MFFIKNSCPGTSAKAHRVSSGFCFEHKKCLEPDELLGSTEIITRNTMSRGSLNFDELYLRGYWELEANQGIRVYLRE